MRLVALRNSNGKYSVRIVFEESDKERLFPHGDVGAGNGEQKATIQVKNFARFSSCYTVEFTSRCMETYMGSCVYTAFVFPASCRNPHVHEETLHVCVYSYNISTDMYHVLSYPRAKVYSVESWVNMG
jgi:hypothetical protein